MSFPAVPETPRPGSSSSEVDVLDYSLPLSDVLRESTKEGHKAIEHSNGASLLLAGKLTREEYVRFLMMLWHVYAALEIALDRHSTNPVLEPTYNAPLLRRSPSLSSDISHILGVPEWKIHPLHKELLDSAPPELTDYVDRIHELSDSKDDVPKLLAHGYVRYLGDLSGGQSIRRVIAKTYGLEEDTGLGISFYKFKELKTGKNAGQGEMKRIKDWYRNGMNAGAQDERLKKAIADEANKVFYLNNGLFNVMVVNKEEKEHLAEISRDYEKALEAEEQPVLILPPPKDGNGWNVANVATVIVAVSVAHFALTIAGFTGSKGYAKLELLEEWIAGTWNTVVASAQGAVGA